MTLAATYLLIDTIKQAIWDASCSPPL